MSDPLAAYKNAEIAWNRFLLQYFLVVPMLLSFAPATRTPWQFIAQLLVARKTVAAKAMRAALAQWVRVAALAWLWASQTERFGNPGWIYSTWDGDEAVLILDSKPWSGMILEATHLEHMICRSVFDLLGIYIVHLHLLAVRCSLKNWHRREVYRRKLGRVDQLWFDGNC